MKKKPIIISISGISGSGKTTITKALTSMLKNCITISFDDYDEMLPTDFFDWSERGADANEYILTPMIDDLVKAINTNPEYILLDYPFGYGNDVMSKYIDFAVYVDIPLDVAMARRILRDFLAKDPNRRTFPHPREQLAGELKFYLERSRKIYTQHFEVVKPHVDFVIDGCDKPEYNAQIIINAIESR